jgi:hypothetical protein
MARALRCMTIALCLVPLRELSADTLVSNLGSPENATPIVGDNDGDWRRAAGFTTGSNPAGYGLNSVTMGFTSAVNEPAATFRLDLFSEAGGVPDSAIVQLSGSNSPISGLFTYTGSTILGPNTEYFLVSSAPQPLSSFQVFRHSSTSDDGETSPDGWTIGDSNFWCYTYLEVGPWTEASDGQQFRFSVDATPVPEPATLVLLGMGAIGCVMLGRRSRRGRPSPPVCSG